MERPSDIKELLLYFIEEREKARYMKENGIFPHTEDPILAAYRFCNINREHDNVTRWVAENVRQLDIPHLEMVMNLAAARVFNEPTALKHVLPFKEPSRLAARLMQIKAKGETVFRGAYMMPVHGGHSGEKSAVTYWCNNIGQIRQQGLAQPHDTLAAVAQAIRSCSGFGPFLANQICTDLRYTRFYDRNRCDDWTTYVAAGPGTTRGVLRYLSCKPYGKAAPPRGGVGGALVLKIREELFDLVSDEVQRHFDDPNNVANTFCEFDKFCRAVEIPAGDNRHRVTLRKYQTPQ